MTPKKLKDQLDENEARSIIEIRDGDNPIPDGDSGFRRN